MNIGRWVHFSINDVIGCFKWIFERQPSSIFEEPMLANLKSWHELYGLHCDLYVFEMTEGFHLEQLQNEYWNELKTAASWLKLAWHGQQNTQGTDDVEGKLASLNRVYSLISSKASNASWSSIVRLYGYQAPESVLQRITELGSQVFLTADREICSYDLAEADVAQLQKTGALYKNARSYWKTDWCFDQFADGITTDVALMHFTQTLRQSKGKLPICISCNEWKFRQIAQETDAFWARFSEIELPLYWNTSVLVGKWLYFTTCNTDHLFRRHTDTGCIEVVAALPCCTSGTMKYASLIHYKDQIWMIPHHENNIVIYCIELRKFLVFPVPHECQGIQYRKAIQSGKELWLLPGKARCLEKIDMETLSVQTYSDWPQGVTFSDKTTLDFKMMYLYENELFLFRDGCSHNVCFDVRSGKMEIWDIPLSGKFGCIADEKAAIAPYHAGEPIEIYDLESSARLETIKPPDWIWKEKTQLSAFLWTEKIGEHIFFLPHEANGIIRWNMYTGHTDYIELTSMDYSTTYWTDALGVYEVIRIQGMDWFLPISADTAVVCDADGKIADTIRFSLPLGQLNRIIALAEEVHESDATALAELLDRLCGIERREWLQTKPTHNNNGTIGEAIYRMLRKE